MSHVTRGKLFAVGAAVLLSAPMILPTQHVKADTVNFGMSITPSCVIASENVAFWNVNNSNPSDVSISWNNLDDSETDAVLVPAGESIIATSYKVDANNTTKFNWGYGEGQTNAGNTECEVEEAPAPTTPLNCVDVHATDGYMQQHVKVTYLSDNQVQVDYDALDCDATINFSSYTMRRDYDGGAFYGNPTASPQTGFEHAMFDIKAGQAGTMMLEVNLPDECENVQTDVYFGARVENVDANGHGTFNLGQPGFPGSQVYLSNGTCEVTPGQGGGGETTPTPEAPVTPVTPVTPATPVAQTPGKGAGTPATLAYTGTSPVLPYTIAAILAAFTALGTAVVRRNSRV